ncbi:MAG TPA: GntR family transcriptional regulator [Marmoricola sp.]|jgi:DNA-binding GntR family transcriptional regulator|nr:GntR family transcriptional regulator [Marmoricola sp.]
MTAVPVPKTAHAAAYESLRARILSGELEPGTALVQAALAAELGVSMTPIREALRNLTSEGLVTMSAHRGAMVTALDVEDAREIHRIRLMLEPEAVRLAVPRATPAGLDRAEQLIIEMREVSGADWSRLNFEFHRLIVSFAGSPRLVNILGVLQDGARRYVGVALKHRHDAPPPEDEHQQILKAYRDGNVEGAVRAITAHIGSSLASFDDDEPLSSGQSLDVFEGLAR